MKTLRWSVFALALLAPGLLVRPTVAQDAAPEKSLIQRYLEATEAKKPEFRKQLLDLGADGLRKAIAEYRFQKPTQAGTVKLRTMCPDGFVRPMWVYVPEKYDPAKSYPLIVQMHGGVAGTPLDDEEFAPGQYEMETWKQVLPEDWQNEVILLGVSAGVPETNEEAAWWRNGGQRNVLHMVRETRRLMNIDDDRIFVAGHSDGGSGSFGFAYRRPDTFAGFFPMNGHPLVPMSAGVMVWLENLKGSNIYAVNGGADRLYPGAQVSPIYEQANSVGASIQHTAHEKLGHQITPVLEEEVAGILAKRVSTWKRNRTPTSIDWTTDNAESGRRAWLEVAELIDLGKQNAAPANADIKTPGRRVRLGVQLSQDADAPTVDTIVAGSTAEKMGVKTGDVILKLDDTAVASIDDLLAALGKKAPGDNVTLTIMRGDKEQVLKGQFEKGEPQSAPRGLEARATAELKPGLVTVKVRNCGKLVLHVTAQMLDAEGKLKVVLQRADGSELVLRQSAPVAADAAAILDAFEAGCDRKDATIARIELDVATALDIKRKPKSPPQQEDDF